MCREQRNQHFCRPSWMANWQMDPSEAKIWKKNEPANNDHCCRSFEIDLGWRQISLLTHSQCSCQSNDAFATFSPLLSSFAFSTLSIQWKMRPLFDQKSVSHFQSSFWHTSNFGYSTFIDGRRTKLDRFSTVNAHEKYSSCHRWSSEINLDIHLPELILDLQLLNLSQKQQWFVNHVTVY